MSKQIVKVDIDDTLAVVQEIFENVHFHHLLVTEKGRLVGVISDRDLLKAVSPYIGTGAETTRDLMSLNKRVHQIYSRRLITATPDTTIHEAIRLFNEHRVSCMPVVNANGTAVGILSWRDIFKLLEDQHEQKQLLKSSIKPNS